MKTIVSLSGGVSSAVACDRAIKKYGRENVTIWIADTSAEDADLWRFVDDCMARWGGQLIKYCDGRDPLQVFDDKKIIGNSMIAPCTFVLKIEPFVKFLKSHEKPVQVAIGLNWDEQHRLEAPRARYEAMDGVSVVFPLMWKPYCWDVFSEVRGWGIEPPRLYAAGFPHNNCGGACIKQGKKEWLRLRAHDLARFEKYRDWETQARERLGDYAFLREQRNGERCPLPLAELEKQTASTVEGAGTQEDLFSCFCSY